MTLDKFSSVLDGICHGPDDYGTYTNDHGVVGYFAKYQVGHNFYWYGVSDMTESVSPTEVANAIRKGSVSRQGPYKTNSFEATVRYEGHAYMLGAGGPGVKH
ncbi:MAG TPA: hypothetical protein VH250_03525 [Granulicella sp.]|nr:hypothetical protein [Granulicella sp.]